MENAAAAASSCDLLSVPAEPSDPLFLLPKHAICDKAYDPS
jgi:hypothetical protein